MITGRRVAGFQRGGAVAVRGVFRDWLDVMAVEIDRNMQGPGQYAFENAVTEGRFLDDYCNWTRIPEFERILSERPVAELGARVMEW